MATLSRRGDRTLYLFSTGAEDIESFAAEFGADGAGLAEYPGAEMHIVPGMDHSLTITAGRVPAETMMIQFVLAGTKGLAPVTSSDSDLYRGHHANMSR